MTGLAKKTPTDLRIIDWVGTIAATIAGALALYGLSVHWPGPTINLIVAIGVSIGAARGIFTLARPLDWFMRLESRPRWFASLSAAFFGVCWICVLSKPTHP